MTTLNLDLPDGVLRDLRRIAEEQATTVEALATNAIIGMLGTDPALEAAIAEAEAEVAAGHVVPAGEVFAEIDAIIASAQARQRR
jgi:predicted transcriptional regulator